jgi:hypothetical protein
MTVINLGDTVIDRPGATCPDNTVISQANPATVAGILHTVKVWCNVSFTSFKPGIFYWVSGTTWKCRSSVAIGAVVSGAERTFTGLSLPFQPGDCIGCYFLAGEMEIDAGAFAGFKMASSQDCADPDDECFYSANDGWTISLAGIGESIAGGGGEVMSLLLGGR